MAALTPAAYLLGLSNLVKIQTQVISIGYYDFGTLFPADNYRHFGGLSRYWPAAYFISYHLGRACLKLEIRSILSNIAFTPEDQAPIHCSGRGVDTAHLQR